MGTGGKGDRAAPQGRFRVTAVHVPVDICHFTAIIPNVFPCLRPRTHLKKSQKSEIGPKERLYLLECPQWEDWTN